MPTSEAALELDEWLAGDRLSLADLSVTSFDQRMEHLDHKMLFAGRPHLQAWFARIKELPSYQTAMVDWFNSDYLALCEKTGREAQPAISAMLAPA